VDVAHAAASDSLYCVAVLVRHSAVPRLLAAALTEFRTQEQCTYNSFEAVLPLTDDLDHTTIGLALPLVNRDNEVKQYATRLKSNIALRRKLSEASSAAAPVSTSEKTLEKFKREWKHPAVAGAPGTGKTTMMERGYLSAVQSDDELRSLATGRHFRWDLHVPLTPDEITLLKDGNAAIVLALHILHQSVNREQRFAPFLSDLKKVLAQHHLDVGDLSLTAVLDHIIVPPPLQASASSSSSFSPALPRLVLLNISETNQLFVTHEAHRVAAFMKASYGFNLEQDKYMLVTAFEGTHRRELLDSFTVSGTLSDLITLPARAIDYSALLSKVIRPLCNARDETVATVAKRICRHPTPPWDCPAFKAALTEVMNPRLFSLLLYAVGTFQADPSTSTAATTSTSAAATSSTSTAATGHKPSERTIPFSVQRLLSHLFELRDKPPKDQAAVVDKWMTYVQTLMQMHFSHYVKLLQILPPSSFLVLLAHVMFDEPVAVEDQKLLGSNVTWRELEKDGAIVLIAMDRGHKVDVAYVMLSLAASHFVMTNYRPVLRFLPLLTTRNASTPRSNELCDLAVFTLRLVLLKSKVSPGAITFRLSFFVF